MAIFSKLFGDLMSHIIREYADEEMKHLLYNLPLKIMGILLSVFLVSSLYVVSVKLTVKISSIFVAFLENMNFNCKVQVFKKATKFETISHLI